MNETMRISQSIYISFLLICFSGTTLAQSPQTMQIPNLNGRWLLTGEESKTGRPELDMETKLLQKRCKEELKIEQNEPEIRLSRISTCSNGNRSKAPIVSEIKYIYYTDGRGESNISEMDVIIASVSQWKENSFLVNQYKALPKLGGKTKKSPRTIELRLSNDGRNLTELIEDSGTLFDSVPMKSKIVFTREK